MAHASKLVHKLIALVAFAGLATIASTAAAQPKAVPGDRCSPSIANNAAAASVCTPVCEKAGLTFGGNWSNDANHPPVKACMAKSEGVSVCGCAAKPAAVPGDRCGPLVANNGAAASVCAPICEKAGLKFAGNWSNDTKHPPVKACIAKREGVSVCGCAAK